MKITDINSRLDRMCVLSFTQVSPWFELAEKLGKAMPVQIYRGENGTFILGYVSKEGLTGSLASTVRANENVQEKKHYYTIAEKLGSTEHEALISEIMKVPSVVSTGSYLLGRELYVTFRFHSSRSLDINSILLRMHGIRQRVRVAFYGPSFGLSEILKVINERVPLSVLRYSIVLASAEQYNQEVMSGGFEVLAEVESRQATDENVKLVMYPEKEIAGDYVVISGQDRIYERVTSQKFLEEARKKADDSRIPRVSVILRIKGRRLEITTFLPADEANSYLSVLYSLPSMGENDGILVDLFSRFDPGMFDWL